MILAASILGADFGRLDAHTPEALDAGAEGVHVDVLDGHFVPTHSLGGPALQELRAAAAEAGRWVMEACERADSTASDSRAFVSAFMAPPEPNIKARAAARRHENFARG